MKTHCPTERDGKLYANSPTSLRRASPVISGLRLQWGAGQDGQLRSIWKRKVRSKFSGLETAKSRDSASRVAGLAEQSNQSDQSDSDQTDQSNPQHERSLDNKGVRRARFPEQSEQSEQSGPQLELRRSEQSDQSDLRWPTSAASRWDGKKVVHENLPEPPAGR